MLPTPRAARAAFVLFLFGSSAVAADGPAWMVKDISTTSVSGLYAYLDAAAGNRLVFTPYGRLWSSDGTSAGTSVIPGVALEGPYFRGSFDGFVYMNAADDLHGRELWRTDGTLEGTRLVYDLTPGFTGSIVTELVRFRGSLYFGAATEVSYFGPYALWKTDGTPEGTVRVSDTGPGVSLAVVGDRLVFVALTDRSLQSPTPYTLFVTDGTDAGTRRIRDFAPHPFGTVCPGSCPTTGPNGFVVVDGVAYFRANDGENGLELWRTDGTPGGTWMVRDVCPGPCFGLFDPGPIRVLGHSVFFVAFDPLHGSELWTSDGTSRGTHLVRDVFPGEPSGAYGLRSSVASMEAGRDAIFFTGYDPDLGAQIWKSDGTEAGTRAITLFPTGLYPDLLTRLGDDIYFVTYTETSATQLWAVDTATDSARLVTSLESEPAGLVEFGGSVFFEALRQGDAWLWKSDGTSSGTFPLVLLRTALSQASTSFKFIGDIGGRLLFGARTAYGPTSLWTSDGSEAGTRLVSDVEVGVRFDDHVPFFAGFQDSIFFASADGTDPPELWRTDGTAAGTYHVPMIGTPPMADPCGLSVVGGNLLFADRAGSGLWKSDGSSAQLFEPIAVPCGWTPPILAWNGFGFFGSWTYAPGPDQGLWKTDGTPRGTVHLWNEISSPIASFGSRLFVSTLTGVFTSRGQPGDLVPLPISGTTYVSAQADSGVFVLVENDLANEYQLWRTDGTPGGTVRLGGWPLIDLRPEQLVAVGRRVFFSAGDPERGRELWASDGTLEGTGIVLDIAPGPADSNPQNLTAIGGVLLFSARDERHGEELWRSDGTPEGTFRLQDINPGPDSSSPEGFTRAGSLVCFSADDGEHGRELWAIPVAELDPPPGRRVREPLVLPSRR